MKEDSELLRERLSSILNDQNITINRLATLSGLKQSSVNNLYDGSTKSPKIGTLRKIARGLGISLTELLDFPPYNEVEK